MKENNTCPWCKSKDVYLMAADEWKLTWHCEHCRADFQIENAEYQFEKQEHDMKHKI